MLKDGRLIKQGITTELTSEIDTCVWKLVIQERSVPHELEQFQISNMIREKDGIHLRIVSERKPHREAVSVKPNLEDVFLYYCGEKHE